MEDEIPFDVPDGWSWCRLRNIGDYKKGPFGSALTKSIFVPKTENTIKVYEQKNAIQHNHLLGNYYISKEYFEKEMQSFEVLPGDIIVSCAGTIGETYILPNNIEKGIINQALMRMRLTSLLHISYFLIYFEHILKEEAAKSGKGTAIKNIPPFDVFKNFLLPLPPLSEQKLIVEEIEKIFAQIDLLEQNKTDLQTAIKQAKSKILDLAIHGKLVPQDPNEEPASVLLEKIRAEKEQKIANGEIKRDKNDSFIYKSTTDNCHYQKKADGTIVNIEDEIPFDLPEGWSWCRLGEICQILMGQSPAGDNVSENKDGIEFHQGKIYFKDKYLAHSNIKTSEITRISDKESLLLCVRAPVGVVNITDRKICIGRGLCSIKPIYNISIDFWFYWIINQKETLELQATGTTFKAVTVDTIKNLLIPLPPLAEQQRIVTKIEEVFTQLDSIKNEL